MNLKCGLDDLAEIMGPWELTLEKTTPWKLRILDTHKSSAHVRSFLVMVTTNLSSGYFLESRCFKTPVDLLLFLEK